MVNNKYGIKYANRIEKSDIGINDEIKYVKMWFNGGCGELFPPILNIKNLKIIKNKTAQDIL